MAEFAALVRHLGGEALALPRVFLGPIPIAAIGTLAALDVWGVIGSSHETVHTARRLARCGRLGLVVGSDPATDRWSAVINVHPMRPVAMLRGDVMALPFRRLARAVRAASVTSLEQAVAFAEALDVDAEGRRTFRLLHGLIRAGVEMLPRSVRLEDRHAWTLAQLTRLLFLRFVESEGWLDGNPRFLLDGFDRCAAARRDPTRYFLDPLFFGTLNRPAHERSALARSFGAVPFLNGGLFEPHVIERRIKMRLPVSYWQHAFEALVERVDVTLDADADDGRVAPELLGRVFEGVMQPAERKEHGTFFTPPALVEALVRDALTCHLAWRMPRGESELARSLDDPDPVLRRTLLDVAVLDPAVGSGAFLVGALAILHGPGPRHAGRTRFLVTRRLYGVDRHPDAVRLCELRLWLEVLRAMRGRSIAEIPPLPNLDARVRAGDTLIDPLHHETVGRRAAQLIAARQRSIDGMHGQPKRAAITSARASERRAVLEALEQRRDQLQQDIAQWLAAARAPTLFGGRHRVGTAGRRELVTLRAAMWRCRAELRRLARDASSAPFAIRTAFAPVFARRGGFDLVLGNPPWIRAERLAPSTRDTLMQRYRWWRGSGTGWQHLPDIAIAFMERSVELAAPDGTVALLVPAKIATANYGAAARASLATKTSLHCVADLADDPRAGFDATTYPLALIASRRPPSATDRVRLGLTRDAPTAPQQQWGSAATWSLGSPEIHRIAARLSREHPPLSEHVAAQLGLKTGANAAFIDPPAALHAWGRPAIRGRDIRPFSAPAGTMVLWPADDRGVPWETLPTPVAEYLETHALRLKRRADHHNGPWWQLFRTRAATAPHRVIWRDLAPTLQAAVVWRSSDVPLNSCYVAAVRSELIAASLAAWLNATPIRVLARLVAEPAAGGCARYAARAVGAIPLPAVALGDPVLAAFCHTAAGHDVQDALDSHVAQLLDLSTSERQLFDAVAARRR